MRKAQTATEYLIILAVVLIIALIVVGVLGGVPGVSGSSRARTSIAFWSSANIAITSSAISPTQTLLQIRNNQLNTITINSVSLDGTPLAGPGMAPQTLITGQVGTFTSPTITCPAGSSFSYDVLINYTDIETGKPYTFDGYGQTLEGLCANS